LQDLPEEVFHDSGTEGSFICRTRRKTRSFDAGEGIIAAMSTGTVRSEKLFYRLLPQTEPDWQRLRAFFEGKPGFIPPIQLGTASVAETADGEIVGAVIVQPVSYMGPLSIDPDWTGQVDYAALKAPIDDIFKNGNKTHLIIQGYIVLTTDERIARIAEMSGMDRKPEAILLVQTFGGDVVIT
jgi:hypothetical protein